jgi:hypothetical protein
MKFIIKKASDWDYIEEIEINTLEELLKFYKVNGEIVIRDNVYMLDKYPDAKTILQIYDAYIE